jgi:hypothetical protein
MKKFFLILVLVLVSFFALNTLKSEETKTPTSLIISLNQDPAFGFYPMFWGSYGLSEKIALTTYGIFWTQDALAGKNGGLNLLTEIGVGVNFTLLDGALNINPAIGLGNGNFQSGGGRAIVGDNIVPQVGITYTNGDFSVYAASVNWINLRKESKVTNNYDLFEYSVNPMYSYNKYFALGLTYDRFLYIDHTPKEDVTYTSYDWIGPTFKLTFNSGASATFSAGVDFQDYDNKNIADNDKILRDFYRLQVAFPF